MRGFMTVHANPVGLQRRVEIRLLAPLAKRFRVYAVGRAPGMSADASMADLAREHAEAIRAEFGTAVDVLGFSSGGSHAPANGGGRTRRAVDVYPGTGHGGTFTSRRFVADVTTFLQERS